MSFSRKERKGRKEGETAMKKMMIIAGLSMALSGCIGFSWTSKVDDGAVYVLNCEMYIAEEDGLNHQRRSFLSPLRERRTWNAHVRACHAGRL